MRVEFRITSGSRADQRDVFDQSVIAVGRHPMNDLRFDVDKDPEVSSKHAEIRIVGDTVTLKDLASTNGTYVNGQRVTGERVLAEGDVISFGDAGPKAEFGRAADAAEKQNAKLRNMIGALAGLIVVGVGIAYWAGSRGSAEAAKQVERLVHQNDSLGTLIDATVTQMQGKSAGIDSALQAARRESEDLRARLQTAAKGANAANVALLSSELGASATRQRALVGAAQVDWEAVAAQNAPALAFLAVDLGEEGLVSGTGFNANPSGLIVTNRHLVQDSKGRPATRIRAKFETSDGGWKNVTVVKVSATDELAWLKIEGGGTFPTIKGVARSAAVHVGAPVAIIGYPLGTGTAGMGGAINQLKPVSTLTVGTASKVLSDTLQLDVYAAQGSSGSPVFNAQGFVVGVLFGSPTESNGRIIYAVAASKLVAQMPPEGAAIVK